MAADPAPSPVMTLEETTQELLDAIEAEDLDAIASALEARSAAINNGLSVSQDVLEAGERAFRALRELQQRWAGESARLRQISAAFVHASNPTGSRLDFRG